MHILFTINRGTNRFYIGDSESPLAEMTYVNAGDKIIIIDSTKVSDQLRGQGVGKILLKEVVCLAREEHKKITPLCPFTKAEMNKNADYTDLIY
ncbi:GNAT family N-acetyltransferase [Alkalibaculum bacchi]|uniref:GNAT family N-acetyltransferase n=1 Tax=Alkalibaculum bacchi TaxID=645887 RepID=UPI001FAA2FE4|nr:GNAT family N-acetyltransferase [Alkalibaculum bacchi]